MIRLMDVVLLAGITAALLAPVIYALSTLRRMRSKKLYLVFRLKAPHGETSFIKVASNH